MLLDNQTLTKVIQDAVRMTIIPDYIGWALSIIGITVASVSILFAILIYRKQKREAEIQKQFRNNLINSVKGRMKTMISYYKKQIGIEMKLVDLSNGNEKEKLAFAQQLMKDSKKSHIELADSIIQDADFIRTDIDDSLYISIRLVFDRSKRFVDENELSVNFGSELATLNNWKNIGETITENIEKIMSKL